ncbi:hypothetical protein [Bacillus cytotoxicus]|uniref:hypothetical protein n=1 Tax=Bacillus cytotoxicus TaxID=580165 RepID=UPI003D7C4F3C
MIGSKRVKRQIEASVQAFESCNRFLAHLVDKYDFNEEEKEDLQKLQYQLKVLQKNLGRMKQDSML